MKLRLVALLAGLIAAALPLAAAAQVSSNPVIGFLHSQSPAPSYLDVAKFREGLREEGYVEGRNVNVEYRWGNNDAAELTKGAADLVQRRVAVIVTAGGLVAGRAAKAATTTIPIVFVTGLDPAENGFVASLNHPGGNATGVVNYNREIMPKRLELLRELVGLQPTARVAYLINNADMDLSPGLRKQLENERSVAGALGLIIHYARTAPEIDQAFEAIAQEHIDALLVGSDPFFTGQREHLVKLAAENKLPAGFQQREFAEAGGLISYGPSGPDSLRQAGKYAAQILKGGNPADMPVLTPVKLELVINLKTAATLGLQMDRREMRDLLVSADEIIK